MEDSGAGHRHTDDEIAEILRRALQPRAGGQLPVPAAEGLSLSELEKVASEAGIDPVRVREAALALSAEPPTSGGSLVFGPGANYVFERTVTGEVAEERFADIVAAIRRHTRNKGKVQEYSDWLEWRSDAGSIAVTVKPRDGSTHVQVMCDGGFKAVAIWAPAGLATLIAVIATGIALGTLPLELGTLYIGGGYGIGRSLWEWVGRKSANKYRELAGRISEEVARLARE